MSACLNIRDALDAALRSHADHENIIEALWQMFAGAVEVPPGGTQWIESRRCFFAGAMTLFEAVMRIIEHGAEPTAADYARVGAIAAELERFGKDLASGLG